MLIHLPSATRESDVRAAIDVLRRSRETRFIVETGALVRTKGRIVGGVLVIEHSRDLAYAIGSLRRAGIEAISRRLAKFARVYGHPGQPLVHAQKIVA